MTTQPHDDTSDERSTRSITFRTLSALIFLALTFFAAVIVVQLFLPELSNPAGLHRRLMVFLLLLPTTTLIGAAALAARLATHSAPRNLAWSSFPLWIARAVGPAIPAAVFLTFTFPDAFELLSRADVCPPLALCLTFVTVAGGAVQWRLWAPRRPLSIRETD